MAETDKKTALILLYDAWDEDGNRLPAAPVIGAHAETGDAIREEQTLVSAELAKKLVAARKAEVPLK